MMKKFKLFKLFVLITALLLTSWVYPAQGQKAQFKIISETGVPEEANGHVQQGVDAILRFFKETYHLELKKDYRIILVANKESYITALMREDKKADQKEAERRARTTIGWTIGDAIILNAARLPDARRRIYTVSHEITHKFQGEICSGNCNHVMWMYEGAPTALGNRVTEILGMRSMTQTKKAWRQELRKISTPPALQELKSEKDWFNALDKYGSDPTYGLTGLAVFNLIEQKGYEPLFVYFKKMKDWRGEDSFKMAFGLNLDNYENEFSTILKKEMKAAGK